jgi:tripartite-type tricarboxylate transporter receptor subunit TctC
MYQVRCGLLARPTVPSHVKAAKLVALAVSGGQRSPTLPDAPTMAEAGVPGYEAKLSLMMYASKGRPHPSPSACARSLWKR